MYRFTIKGTFWLINDKNVNCPGSYRCIGLLFEFKISGSHTSLCGELFFTCKNGVCINLTWTCDNVTHCLDGSDEDSEYANCKCNLIIIRTELFEAYNTLNIQRCIQNDY